MANSCYFNLKVAGDGAKCVEFYKMLESEETWAIEEVELHSIGAENGCFFMEFSGECKWSVLSAMDKREDRTNERTLKQESKRLGLEIEVYSTENGVGFAEHIWYRNGEVLEDECVDYREFYWDKTDHPTIESYNQAYNTDVCEKDFDDCGWHFKGGFGDWTFFSASR